MYAVNGTKKGTTYKLTGLTASKADYIRLSFEADGWTAVIVQETETVSEQPYMTRATVGVCADKGDTAKRPSGILTRLGKWFTALCIVYLSGRMIYVLCYDHQEIIPVLTSIGFGLLLAVFLFYSVKFFRKGE